MVPKVARNERTIYLFTSGGSYITGDIRFMQNCVAHRVIILSIFIKPAALILLVIFFLKQKCKSVTSECSTIFVSICLHAIQ